MPDLPLCVFVSLEDSTGHIIDDERCEPYFLEQGWRLETWPWTSAKPWHKADLIVLRSCYDYWLHPTKFEEFLRAREHTGTPLLNPAKLLRWNANKRYLSRLERCGISVIPSLIIDDKTTARDREQFMEAQGFAKEFVVKPLVGSGGFAMRKLLRNDLKNLHCPEESLLQPFLPSIGEGEWSAIFFNGAPSHVVRKVAAPGEYRVQDSHGGSTHAVTWDSNPKLLPFAEGVAQAMKSLDLPPPCYARYDFIRADHTEDLLLMEVELIEPTLFLDLDEHAPRTFVQSILSYHRDPQRA